MGFKLKPSGGFEAKERMMKSLIFAAALGISSVALAQTTDDTQTTTGTEETTEGQTTGTEGMATGTGTGGTTTGSMDATGTGGTTGADTSMSAGGGMTAGTMTGGGGTVAPGNTNPERDARGIPVVSDAATAPAGANASVQVMPGARVVASPNQAAAFQTQPSTQTYQACTRTVTDNCVQTYERGSRR
jgi:hypothetical protein